MNIQVSGPSEFTTTSWAGGTTTELMIYPQASSYKALDFDFRLSIATVNLEKSVFTSLPGIFRTLMVLDGSLKLVHEGHHTAQLKKFESDHFMGNWITTSFGQATDFNLMTTQGTQGTVTGLRLAPETYVELQEPANSKIIICYVLRGALEVEGAPSTVEAGALLSLSNFEINDKMPAIKALNDTEVVVVHIQG
ncbi:hypothetical protein GCM10009122_33380 [Fulvivirga kasyanovii]|uniref:HutD family protein n=1 Tax=Fulvivirga kasyanovii TaxID=396812 RepID=A0ABW9RLA2_9BACT|nr:HutD family protein [Fulvivirga kasyanovii]MTI24715.1 hypothetical protein [Fulvivirga kasyanovii]